MSGWKHCPMCGKELEKILHHFGEKCTACQREMNDPVFESMAGHVACTVPDVDNADRKYASACDIHICYDCHYGPIAGVPAMQFSRVWFASSGCRKCQDPPGTFFRCCDGCASEMVWAGPMTMKCLKCGAEETLESRVGKEECDCEENPITIRFHYLGQPRVMHERRRPRSPSPQNVKREPSSSSSSSSSDEDDEEEATEQSNSKKKKKPTPKAKKAAPKKKPSAKKTSK